MNEVVKANTTAVARVYKSTGCAVVDKAIVDVSAMTASLENNSKELARCFYDLRRAHSENKGVNGYEYADSKFPEMIDSVFKGVYSGATAHKYAKTFETFALTKTLYNEMRTCWEWFTMGKLNSIKAILTIDSKKSKEKWENNVNVFNFLAKFGNEVNDRMTEKLNEWYEVNAKVDEMREKVKDIFDTETIERQFPYVGEKPQIAPPVPEMPTDKTDENMEKYARDMNAHWTKIAEFGAQYLSCYSDSDFKKEVEKFISDQRPETPVEPETPAETETPAEFETSEMVLARIIVDMGTYASVFGEKIPTWYSSTLEKLKARQTK